MHLIMDIISSPLSQIINLSFSTGTFPEKLKTSKTIPIFKKGSKLEAANYRPILLLSNLNKILEKLMYSRIIKFLKKYKCIYNLQFGFREKHSTNHALIDITETIRFLFLFVCLLIFFQPLKPYYRIQISIHITYTNSKNKNIIINEIKCF